MSTVSYELRGRVAWVGLDRADKRNAINAAVLRDLRQAIARAQDESRAIVVFGHGRCFSAGLDLTEHRQRDAEETFLLSRAWHDVFNGIRRGRRPVLAALHGATVGGGLELAAACHIRIADATARFALPEAQHGIYVGGGASVFVARLIGTARMTDMMLTGRTLDTIEAERVGLVQYAVPAGEAPGLAEELAAKVAEVPPLTVLGILQALPRIQAMSEGDGLFAESMMTALAQTGSEATDRLARFSQNRKSASL